MKDSGDIAAAAASPLEARVTEQRDDGSALVEVPVMVVTDTLDLGKTQTGSNAKIAFGLAELREMAANFSLWPMPVAVGFDGFDGHQKQRAGPQRAFVNALRVVGDVLMAVVDLGSAAAGLVVKDRAYRGFSMEALKNPKTPTVDLVGWVLTGGIFTNQPATDSQFRIAASSEDITEDARGTHLAKLNVNNLGKAPRREDTAMDEGKTALAQADLALANKANDALRVELAEEKGRYEDTRTKLATALTSQADKDEALVKSEVELSAKRGEVTALTAERDKLRRQVTELSAQVTERDDADLAAKIVALSEAAVADGRIAASFFEGVEKDPLSWFRGKGFVNTEALENVIQCATPVKAAAAVSSGKAPEPNPDTAADKMTEDRKAQLVALGIDPKFVDVDNEDELRALMAKEQKKHEGE